MKTTLYAVLMAVLASTIVPCAVRAQGEFASKTRQEVRDWQSIGMGIRLHARNESIASLPFSDGDISYRLSYFNEDKNFSVQLVADYTPMFKNSETSGYAVTPGLNIFLKDDMGKHIPGFWRLGAGVSKTLRYNTNDESTGTYFPVIIGINIPIGRLDLDIQAFQGFESIGDVKDGFSHADFGFSLNYML